jgi:4-hydroxyacetophenone monooxygenase
MSAKQAPPPRAAGTGFTTEQIDGALAEAHLPSLLMALVHLTRDASILTPERRTRYPSLVEPEVALPAEVQRSIRADARKVLVDYFRQGAPELPSLPMRQLDSMIRYVIGDEAPDSYLPFLEEEIGVADLRRPDWSTAELKQAAARMHVVVIGAGMSGILAGIRLSQAGVECTIIEKNPQVGGTWYDNTYPGCRVDSDNQLYSYSFEPNPRWPQHFSVRDELLRYFQRVTEKHRLRPHIRFNCTVEEARFDDASSKWVVRYVDGEGGHHALSANALISAVGQLNVPRYPDIPGRETFAGPAFHSARWRHDVELSGKRIAVIGTGASAFQFVPEIAPHAMHVDVFQRTPPWLMPTPHYQDDVSAGQKWLLEHVPYYANWYRFWLYWRTVEGAHAAMKAEPDYHEEEGAISTVNAQLRRILLQWIQHQIEGAPQLSIHAVPRYPVGGKRALRDNGLWLKTLRRDNVSVITEEISAIRPEGVLTADGRLHQADVVIYGTGFRASEFLSSYRIFGRGGVDLHQKWSGDARAYLGTMVPDFPNMFVIYGPNTNLVVNGSIILFAECSVGYALGCLKLLAERNCNTVEVRPEVYESYNATLDRENARMAWGLPQVHSWYKNDKGRVTQNWPYPTLAYWQATRSPDPAELRFD